TRFLRLRGRWIAIDLPTRYHPERCDDCGGMAEWLKAAVLKTVDRKVRGFESLSLRQWPRRRGPVSAFAMALCAAGVLTHRPLAADAAVLIGAGDVPLPGNASRFDYQSFDPATGRLFIAHMGDGHLVVFDTHKNQVVADLPGFPRVTGVLFVPELNRIYASAP